MVVLRMSILILLSILMELAFINGWYGRKWDWSNSPSTHLCPDHRSTCGVEETCCASTTGKFGCCHYSSASCCSDGIQCCPHNTRCDLRRNACVRNKKGRKCRFGKCKQLDGKTGWDKIMFPLIRDIEYQWNEMQSCSDGTCHAVETCCSINGGMGCCQYPNATCCNDGIHCCPEGSICDARSQCLQQSIYLVVNDTDSVCPDGGRCESHQTCCRTRAGHYGCCPYSRGSCCIDGVHCCPYGTRCENDQCVRTSYPQSISGTCGIGCPSCCGNGCCSSVDGVCCGIFCCPNGYKCDRRRNMCSIPASGGTRKKLRYNKIGSATHQSAGSTIIPTNVMFQGLNNHEFNHVNSLSICIGGDFACYDSLDIVVGCCPLSHSTCCWDQKRCCSTYSACTPQEHRNNSCVDQY